MKQLSLEEARQVSGSLSVTNGKCQVAYANTISVRVCGNGSITDPETGQDLWNVPDNMVMEFPYLTTIRSGNEACKILITKYSNYYTFELW